MIRRFMCKLGYSLKRPGLWSTLEAVAGMEMDALPVQIERQTVQLRKLIAFAHEKVPYYREVMTDRGLKPADIRTIADLQKLPILTKAIIKNDPEAFRPVDWHEPGILYSSTGGSTGEPLRYRMSAHDYNLGVALTYRAWSMAGYKPGDRMALMAGGSIVDTKDTFLGRMIERVRNIHSISSFGLDDQKLEDFAAYLLRWQPRFFRGYASSLTMFADHCAERGMDGGRFGVQGVFSTSEQLTAGARRKIEQVLAAPVFDQYSANDGGLSATECTEHDGFHIDTERAILECVDEQGAQIECGEGRLLGTALYNHAMPFIRYDSGDLGELTDRACACGDPRRRLSRLLGRSTEFLEIDGLKIGPPVLTVMMGKTRAAHYQIIQEDSLRVVFRIVRGTGYDQEDEDFILSAMTKHCPSVELMFDYVPHLEATGAEKLKFIINRHQQGQAP